MNSKYAQIQKTSCFGNVFFPSDLFNVYRFEHIRNTIQEKIMEVGGTAINQTVRMVVVVQSPDENGQVVAEECVNGFQQRRKSESALQEICIRMFSVQCILDSGGRLDEGEVQKKTVYFVKSRTAFCTILFNVYCNYRLYNQDNLNLY